MDKLTDILNNYREYAEDMKVANHYRIGCNLGLSSTSALIATVNRYLVVNDA